MLSKPIKPNREVWIFLIVHLVCLCFGMSIVGFLLISILTCYAIYEILRKNYQPLFLMLILGSYHSQFNNLYTTEVFGVNFIYILVGVFIIWKGSSIKLNRKTIFLLIPLLFLFILHSILGLFFKYSIAWYINENVSFLFFVLFILITSSLKTQDIEVVIRVLVNYVLYFYPALTLISIATANVENLFFDEFEKFYFISIIPIILARVPNKGFLIALHVIVFALKAKYTYTSSLNILLILSSIVVMFIFSKLAFLRKLALVAVALAGAFIVYQNSSDLTKFKIYQAGVAVSEVLKGDVSAIPKSPRVRVVEIMISFENLAKEGTIFLFTGKGYGSYIDDSKTNYFKKYKIPLKPEDYSEEEIKKKHFKKGHGGIPYIPIKMGIIGMSYFLLISLIGFSLVKKKDLVWLGITAPFYIITTFSYGMKNFIFVGIIIGLVLSIKSGKWSNEKRTVYS